AHTPVTIKSWVDDLNTRIAAPPKFAVDQITKVATILRDDCKELDLISPKSNILSSSVLAGVALEANLKQLGLAVPYKDRVVDLGFDRGNGSSQRSLTTQLQLDMGHSDPAIATAMGVIKSRALFLATSDIDWQLIEATWAR
ncbi:unnamed protein product, partial [Prorocentrum cordatum]